MEVPGLEGRSFDVAGDAALEVAAVDEAAVDEIAEVLEAAFEVAAFEAAEIDEDADTAEAILEVLLLPAFEALLDSTAESEVLEPASEENFEFLEVAEETLDSVEPPAAEVAEVAEKGDVLLANLLQLVDKFLTDFFVDKVPAMLGATLTCLGSPIAVFVFAAFSDFLSTFAPPRFLFQMHTAPKMRTRRSSVPPMPPKSMLLSSFSIPPPPPSPSPSLEATVKERLM